MFVSVIALIYLALKSIKFSFAGIINIGEDTDKVYQESQTSVYTRVYSSKIFTSHATNSRVFENFIWYAFFMRNNCQGLLPPGGGGGTWF